VLLGISIVLELISGGSFDPGPRLSPSDLTPGDAAVLWRFVDQAREHIPDDRVITVMASNPRLEMRLFMIAIGLFPDHQVLPTSYYGRPVPEAGDRAEYVLAFGRARPHDEARCVAELDLGRVYRRTMAPQ
jgi:hypothetical protein